MLNKLREIALCACLATQTSACCGSCSADKSREAIDYASHEAKMQTVRTKCGATPAETIEKQCLQYHCNCLDIVSKLTPGSNIDNNLGGSSGKKGCALDLDLTAKVEGDGARQMAICKSQELDCIDYGARYCTVSDSAIVRTPPAPAPTTSTTPAPTSKTPPAPSNPDGGLVFEYKRD